MKGGPRRKSITSDPLQTDTADHLHLGKRKRGRKPQHQQQPPINDAENGEENEDCEGENNGDEEPPKLAEGFYEIEAIRKTRTRKGVKQYLIKWRGWPESANTWEPADSFTGFPDVIEEFESMKSGKRKRRRKHTVDSTPYLKKKQKQKQKDSPDTEEPCRTLVHNTNVTENNATAGQSKELEGKLDETNDASLTNPENTTEFAIHIKEQPVNQAKGVSKVNEPVACRTSPRIGARRRKSRAVKQFKTAPKKDAAKGTTDASNAIVQGDVKNADDVVNGLESGNILETPLSVSVITKIVKPVNYSITTINDTDDVSVLFLVTRSDGEEIVVDNKYLKEHNPVLLINFYEQHLRYNSASE